jgi:hypothetical protein
MHLVLRRATRGSLVLISLLIAAFVLLGILVSPAKAVTYDPEEVAFLQLLNDYRASLGVQPLLVSDALSLSGDRHDSDMGKYGFFSHYSVESDWFPDNATPWDRMAACGYSYNTWLGENIAAGYSSAQAVFQGWKNSPEHNANMVNPNFTVVGVSMVYVSGSDYGYYWTTDFGGVVDPTAHSLGSAPSSTTTTAYVPPSTTTTTAYVPPSTTNTTASTTTTTAYIRPSTTTTTAYIPPSTTATVAPTTTTTAYVPPTTTTTTTTTAYVPPKTTTTTTTVHEASTTTTTVASAPVFEDVGGGTLYADQIQLMAARGIVSGYGNGLFGPYASVMRQQFAKMIVLALGDSAAPISSCQFRDVGTDSSSADPYYPAGYVAACAALGITVGKTPSMFYPYEQISRAQLITMVARAADLGEPPSWYQPPFGDFSSDHYPWARRAAYAGLLDGFQGLGPSFDFWAPATRGEVCLLLGNLLQRQ